MTVYVTSELGGSWSNPDTWNPRGIPGAGDRANVYGEVIVTGDQSASNTELFRRGTLSFDGGSLHSPVYGRESTTAFIVGPNGGYVTSLQVGHGIIDGGATFTVGKDLIIQDGDDLVVRGSVLKMNGEGGFGIRLLGTMSFSNSSLLVAANAFYGRSTLKLANSDIGASATGTVFTNGGTIVGNGNIGKGTLSFANGDKLSGATLTATGEMTVDAGAGGTVRNLTGSVMEAVGGGTLTIKASGSDDLENKGIIRATGGLVSVSFVDIANQGTVDRPALLQATNRGTLSLASLTVNNTNGQVVVDQGGTLRMSSASIRGGTVTVSGADAKLIVTGEAGIYRGTFNSSGLVQVEAGGKLGVSATSPVTLAAVKLLGELSLSVDASLSGGQKVEIAAGGRLQVSYQTLTNVDEQITGAGILSVTKLVNEAKGRIDGGLTINMGPQPETGGLLVNRGTISNVKVNARAIDNSGTMSGIAFGFPYFATPRGDIDNSGTILNSSFGQGVLVDNKGGTVAARGEDQETTFAGTTLIGGTLSSSDRGTLVVKAAPVATRLDPTAVAADTVIDVANGATLELGPTLGVLDGVHFLVNGSTQDTTLKLLDPSVTLRGQSSVYLAGAPHSTLLVGNVTNEWGYLQGGGVIKEITPETRSLIDNRANGRIESLYGMGSLTVTVDRLINDGLLRADNSTLTIHVATIQGNGQAIVRRGGTIDMSDARQYLGSLRYEGPGTILGPDLVPAGTISGFATGDTYIFGKSNGLVGPLGTLWTANAEGTGGTLTVRTSTGGTYANLVLAGSHYTSADFAATQVALADGNHVAVNFVGALHWAQAVSGNWQDAARWAPTGLFAPGSSDNALIDAAGAAYEVRVTQDTTVRSVATGGSGDLEIQKGSFTALHGSDKWANANTVRVLGGASFTVGGTFGQTATGKVFVLDQGRLNLAGGGALAGGTVYVRAGALMSATQGTASWTNIDVSNTGAIDIGGNTRLDAAGVRLHGDGTTRVGASATLALQDSSANGGTMTLLGTLRVLGTVSLKTQVQMGPGGRIGLGADQGTLINNGTIAGEGSIGGPNLTLTNRNAIVADIGKQLQIDTLANVVSNLGNLFASAGAKLLVSSKLDNQVGVYAGGGTVTLQQDVTNAGLLRAGGAGSRMEIERNVANSGVVAAAGGGIVTVAGAISQTSAGELVAEARGSRLELGAGSSVTGGSIALGGDGALVLGKVGQATLKKVRVTLDEGGDVLVQRGTLVLDDAAVTADSKSFVEVRGSDSRLALIDTAIKGGTVLVERGKIQVANGAILDGTDVYLDLANIVAVNPAKLTNKGVIHGRGSLNRIAGDLLDLDNQGTITTERGANDTIVIDTDLAQILNTGKIAATVAGSQITVHTRVMNRLSGQVLSGAGTVKLDELFNLGGTARASQGGAIEVAGSVDNNTEGLLHADGGALRFAGSVNNSARIQATDGGTVAITGRLSNTSLVQARSGGTVTAQIDVNTSKLLATGVGSGLDLTFIGNGGNRRDIVADEQGKVTIETGLTNSADGRLLAQDGGEIEVHGAVSGGTARLAGGGSLLDLMGSADRDTVLQVSFGTAAPEHLVLGHAERFTGTVKGFALGDTIDVADIAYDPARGTYLYNQDRDQLIVSDGSHQATIALLNDYAANAFTFRSDGQGGTQIILTPPLVPDVASLLAAHA